MTVDELDLCPFCADLVEKGPMASDSTTIAHHFTYGALITSSENCALCVCLCSLLSGPSLLLSEGESCKEWPFQVELAEHCGQFSPDVSWARYEVGVRSLVAPTIIKAKFTLAIRRSKGRNLQQFGTYVSVVPAGVLPGHNDGLFTRRIG